MSRSPLASTRVTVRRTAVVGALVLGLALTGCGGTRESQEAIQAAAGVGQAAPVGTVPQLPAGVPAIPAVPGAPVTGEAPGTPSGEAVAPPVADPNATTPQAPAAGQQPGAGGEGGNQGSQGNQGNQSSQGNQGGKAGGGEAGNKPAAAAPQQQAQVANKSPIKLGVVGTFSGPVGGLVKDTVTGIRAWSQAVNAAAGVNGHPVEILVGDDGGDPARYNSILQQFVEQEGVLAMLYTTLGFAPNGNNKYLDSKQVFTFSTEGGLEVAYNNPYVLTATPTGLTNADSLLLALGKAMKADGSVKFASFACSDFGLCDNFDQRWSAPEVLQKAGFQLVARGRPSLTQPDYTAQCLAAKQAGAQAIMMALDGAAIRRFAGDCARQDYRPQFATADLVATADLPGDENVEGLIIGTKMAPFPDTRVEGVKEAHAAFARYAPGQKITGGMTNGWIIGEFFAQAGKNLPDSPTLKDVEDGLYSVKNNDLKGMTYPITMTRGEPVARQLCYGVAIIEGDNFVTAPGPSLICEKDGKALSALNDYSVTSAVTPASVTTASFTPASLAPAATGSRMFGMSVGAVPPGAWPTVPYARRAEEPACQPARAAGFSYFLDAFQTGFSAGPGVVYGVALAALGTPLPEPFGAAQGQFLAQSGTAVEDFSDSAPAAIQDSRSQFEPFAVYNDYSNAFIDAFANSLDAGADTLGPFIQPGDRSLREFAAAARDARATNVPCEVSPVSSGDPIIDALALAFAQGDTAKAKELLAQDNLAADADRLGKAVFFGGIASTEANAYDAFRTTVAESFVDGGVSPVTAGQAFQAAATAAAEQGLTFEQGAVGFRTVTETFALYFAKGKLS